MRMLFFCGHSSKYIVPRITASGHEVTLATQVIGISQHALLIQDGLLLRTIEPSDFDVALFYASPVDLPIGFNFHGRTQDRADRLNTTPNGRPYASAAPASEDEGSGYTAIQVARRLPRGLPIIDLDPGAGGLPFNVINRAIKLDSFIKYLDARKQENITFVARPRKG